MIWVYFSIFFVGLSIVVKLSILVTSSAASPPHRPEIWISRSLPEARFSLVACKCNPESAMYAQNISKSLGCVCWWVPKRNNRPTRRIERLSPWALTHFQGGCWSKDCQSEVWRGHKIRRDFSGSCPGEDDGTSPIKMEVWAGKTSAITGWIFQQAMFDYRRVFGLVGGFYTNIYIYVYLFQFQWHLAWASNNWPIPAFFHLVQGDQQPVPVLWFGSNYGFGPENRVPLNPSGSLSSSHIFSIKLAFLWGCTHFQTHRNIIW